MCWGILATEPLTKEKLNKTLLGHPSTRVINKGGAKQDMCLDIIAEPLTKEELNETCVGASYQQSH